MIVAISLGYARIVLSFLCFYYLHTEPAVSVVAYLLSQYLDDWDGWAARKYNQGIISYTFLSMNS